ncbi:MAG: FHA domain-containing protein [Candidatus Binataceae bacterium]
MFRRAQPARLLAVDRTAPCTRLLILGREEIAIGSAEGNPLRIEEPSVSARHAVIQYRRGRHYLIGLKTGGGTFLNGKRIRRARRLKHGDHVRFGAEIRYRYIDPDAPIRMRNRRIIGAASVCAIMALGSFAHAKGWDGGLLSIATVREIAAAALPNKAVSAPVLRKSRSGPRRVRLRLPRAPITPLKSRFLAPRRPQLHPHRRNRRGCNKSIITAQSPDWRQFATMCS